MRKTLCMMIAALMLFSLGQSAAMAAVTAEQEQKINPITATEQEAATAEISDGEAQADSTEEPAYEQVVFETTDLDGSTVSSEDIFAGHPVTMISLWATWSVPCRKELSGLEKLSKSFEEKNWQVIGVCLDAAENGKAEKAGRILSAAGVTFLNVTAPTNINRILPANAVPTSFFVDSEGNMLTDPIIGCDPEKYPQLLEEIRAAVDG